jgi:hypothetical protein
MSTTIAAPRPSETPSKPFLSRFCGVYFSPGEAFEDIVRKPSFLAPLVTLIMASLAVTETMLVKIGMQRIIRISLEQGGQAAKMSPEQLDKAVQGGATVGIVFAHAFAVLGTPVFLLIVAGIGLGIINAIFGARASFKTTFSVSCYASLVNVLGALMGIVMILFGDTERFNIQNPVPSNLGFFLNQAETSKPVYSLAGSVDFLSLWLIVLLGIGMSRAAQGKVKSATVSVIYLGMWLIWVLGKAGLSMLG